MISADAFEPYVARLRSAVQEAADKLKAAKNPLEAAELRRDYERMKALLLFAERVRRFLDFC